MYVSPHTMKIVKEAIKREDCLRESEHFKLSQEDVEFYDYLFCTEHSSDKITL